MQMDHRYGVVLTVQDPCKESKNITREKFYQGCFHTQFGSWRTTVICKSNQAGAAKV